MARVNITVPDELLKRARAAGLSISAATVARLTYELEDLEKVAAFDRWLAEDGPISDEELAEAEAWIEGRAFVVGGGKAASA